ncbi:MAG TPA: imelysin family protein [Terriglobales bacterium]|nr:imelysin family protein [Terriglobales bacterium]
MKLQPIAAVVLTLLALACGGCGDRTDNNDDDNGGPSGPTEFDRNALLRTFSDRTVLPALRTFANDSAALAAATAAWQTAAAAGGGTAEREAAQAAWRQAMQSWQAIEVLQIGPAGPINMTMGGQGVRDEIYSWPTVNPCRVDQETVSRDYLSPDFFTRELVNTRGLDALEYLLFDQDQTNACASAVDINASGSWAALVNSGEVNLRRAEYAASAAADVQRRAVELRDAWEPAGGNFAGQLANAGRSGSIYDSAQEAIDEVFAAIFYVELIVKDRKLALPAGLDPDCMANACPELAESRFADASREQILRNLQTAQRIFLGDAAGVGFDDFLRARGAGELAEEMIADFEAAIAAVEAIPGTFSAALANDVDSVRNAYIALKELTDDLKADLVTVLNLTIPQEGAGDND